MDDLLSLQDKAVNGRNYLRGTVKRVSIFQDIFQMGYFVKTNANFSSSTTMEFLIIAITASTPESLNASTTKSRSSKERPMDTTTYNTSVSKLCMQPAAKTQKDQIKKLK